LSGRPPGVHYTEVRSGSHHPGFMIETAASIACRASTSSNMTSRGSWKIAQTLSPGASNCTVLPLTTSGLRLLAIKIGLPVRRKGNEARGFLRATSASGYPVELLVSYQTNRQVSGRILSPEVIRPSGRTAKTGLMHRNKRSENFRSSRLMRYSQFAN
jgi:hypothetical protein